MRERLVGAVAIGLAVLLVGWPMLALLVLANDTVPIQYAIGAAVVVGLIAFGLDTFLSRDTAPDE